MKRRDPQNQVALFPANIETVNNAFSDIRKRILEEKAPVKECKAAVVGKAPISGLEKFSPDSVKTAPVDKVAEALQAKIAIKAARKAEREAAPRAKFSAHNKLCKCRSCGAMTHSSIDGMNGIALCRACLDASQMENDHLDGNHAEDMDGFNPSCPQCVAEAAKKAPEAPKPAQAVVAPKAEAKRTRAPGAGRKTLDNAETLRRPVSIPAAMWHNIQVCGKAQSMSASEVIRRAVAQYLGGEVNDISENQG